MELDLQHGVDEKVDYDPIDKLVGIYNDVIKNKVLTEDEYKNHINVTNTQMKMMMEKTYLMVDFLDFIKANERFYIARDMELDGPLQEIATIRKRYKNDDEWDEVKCILYAYMVAKPKGDITRQVRDIGKILNSQKAAKFIAETEEVAEKIYNAIPEKGKSSQAIRTAIADEKKLISRMNDKVDDYKDKASIETIKGLPVKIAQKVEGQLKEIDDDILERLARTEKVAFAAVLVRIKDRISELEVILDAE